MPVNRRCRVFKQVPSLRHSDDSGFDFRSAFQFDAYVDYSFAPCPGDDGGAARVAAVAGCSPGATAALARCSVPAARCSSASSAVRATITTTPKVHGTPALPTTPDRTRGQLVLGTPGLDLPPSPTMKTTALPSPSTRRRRACRHRSASPSFVARMTVPTNPRNTFASSQSPVTIKPSVVAIGCAAQH